MVSGIDGATGQVTENAELIFTASGQQVLACPHASGGKDWEAGAYSPRTNTMYMPLRNVCARMMAEDPDNRTNRLYAIAWRSELAPGYDDVGSVHAISAETGETIWNYQQRAATMALAATGGGLVFGGDVNGRFRAWVRLFCVGGPEGSRRGCERHGKSYLTRRRRGEEGDGGGSLTGGAIPSA